MATYAPERVATRARRPAVSVDVPIVAAKITAPSVPGWVVSRPRITKLIAQGRRWCLLTVVTGPAGAGKTMALALWAAAEPGMVAWVGLDEFDNRPGVFWAYVVAALRRSGVALPAALPAARPGSSRECRTAGPGPGHSRTWFPPRPRCPLAGMQPVPPRWLPPTASWSAFPPIRRPRPGWPPRLSASPLRFAPATL
jgi:hypothetical protein